MERAKSVLDEAQLIVKGSRKEDYGTPEESFSTIAGYWSHYLTTCISPGETLTARDVALMMILFKIARESNKHKRDNLVDIAGYAACTATLFE